VALCRRVAANTEKELEPKSSPPGDTLAGSRDWQQVFNPLREPNIRDALLQITY
jgi:hypothetical protein